MTTQINKQDNQKHKHYDLIVAWAAGAKIQYKDPIVGNWIDVYDTPMWDKTLEYRVKKEPKPDLVFKRHMHVLDSIALPEGCFPTWNKEDTPNVKITFDGETKKLKKIELI